MQKEQSDWVLEPITESLDSRSNLVYQWFSAMETACDDELRRAKQTLYVSLAKEETPISRDAELKAIWARATFNSGLAAAALRQRRAIWSGPTAKGMVEHAHTCTLNMVNTAHEIGELCKIVQQIYDDCAESRISRPAEFLG